MPSKARIIINKTPIKKEWRKEKIELHQVSVWAAVVNCTPKTNERALACASSLPAKFMTEIHPSTHPSIIHSFHSVHLQAFSPWEFVFFAGFVVKPPHSFWCCIFFPPSIPNTQFNNLLLLLHPSIHPSRFPTLAPTSCTPVAQRPGKPPQQPQPQPQPPLQLQLWLQLVLPSLHYSKNIRYSRDLTSIGSWIYRSLSYIYIHCQENCVEDTRALIWAFNNINKACKARRTNLI